MDLNTKNKIQRKFNEIKPALVAVAGMSVLFSAIYYKGKSDGKVVVILAADDVRNVEI